MGLIDRYIDEVASYLPQRIQADVTTELRSNLEEALEDRLKSGQWTSQEEAEVDLLQELGPPHELADSYVPTPRVLFGPRLYPPFIRTMKIAVGVLIGFAVLGLVADLADSLSLLALGNALVAALRTVLTGFLVILGVAVVVFNFIERTTTAPLSARRHWDPRSLSEVDDPDRIALGELVPSIAFLAVALVVLNVYRDRIGLPLSINDERGWIPLLSAAFDSQMWLLNTCLSLDLGVNLLALFRWRWSTSLRWAGFAVNALYVTWLWRLASGPSIIGVDPSWMVQNGWSAEAAAAYQKLTTGAFARVVAINLWLGFYASVLGLTFQLLKLIKRFFTRR